MSSLLNAEQVRAIQGEFGTPVFVYDRRALERQAAAVLAFPNAFGLTARYAMKACPNAAVIRVLLDAGLHIDASSAYEAERAMRAGCPPERILLTAQQVPDDPEVLRGLAGRGVNFNACSLAQIHAFGRACPGRPLSIRINPGLGSGHSNRTNVGGPAASFGIWHERLDEALAAAQSYDLEIERMHTHIGSGTDPDAWKRVSLMSLDICARIPSARVLSLGGGFKVGRMPGEDSTDLQVVGAPIVDAYRGFAAEHGRELGLEVEPGTYLVANAAVLIATVVDIVDTGDDGYRFLKVDTGMTEIVRPSMYGAQHPIEVVSDAPRRDYLVVGHCCESGDVLTPAPGNPEGLQTRSLAEPRIGDPIVVGGVGAYCAGMSAKNYNSFPEAAEVMIDHDGTPALIRRRQGLEQILQNEIVPSFLDPADRA